MNETESIEMARAYVALLNAHRVDLIQPMFAADAIYRSSAAGEFSGAVAIAKMMRAFFERYPDAYWLCENYRCSGGRVDFALSLQASEAQGSGYLQRSGIEMIEYDGAGLIAKLELRSD